LLLYKSLLYQINYGRIETIYIAINAEKGIF